MNYANAKAVNAETVRKLSIKYADLQEQVKTLKARVKELEKQNKALEKENDALRPAPVIDPSVKPLELSEESQRAILEDRRQRQAEQFILGYCDNCGKSVVDSQDWRRLPYREGVWDGLSTHALYCDAECKRQTQFGKKMGSGKKQSKSPYWGSWK